MNSTMPAPRAPQADAQVKGGRWMPWEKYAESIDLDIELARGMLRPRGRTAKMFDERDVRRFSRTEIHLYVTAPNIAGDCRPRIVPRPKAGPR